MIARNVSILCALVLIAATTNARPSAKAAGTELLTTFMNALLIDDFALSARTIAPMVHPDLRSKHGKSLSKDLLQFSFKKAHANAKHYLSPVHITRIRPYDQDHYTGGATPEPGRIYDFFLARKDKASGSPAPVRLFFPEGDADPLIIYLGNL